MRTLIGLTLLFCFSCSKNDVQNNVAIDSRAKFLGEYNFQVGNVYTYMVSDTMSNGVRYERVLEGYRGDYSNGKIYLGSAINQLLVDWTNDSVSFSYFSRDSNRNVSTQTLPIFLNETNTQFVIDESLNVDLLRQFITQDSFMVEFRRYPNVYFIGGKKI